MLSSETSATRIGGVYALERIATENFEEYHVQIMNLLCAFVRDSLTIPADRLAPILNSILENQTLPVDRQRIRYPRDADAAIAAVVQQNERRAVLARKEVESRVADRQGAILNLEGAVFFDASLRHINFSKAWLADTHFLRTHLDHADFSEAVLWRACFSGSRLHGMKFIRADLADSNFQNARIRDVDFSGAEMHGADFKGTKAVHQAKFMGAALAGSEFTGVLLSQVTFAGARMPWSEFRETEFRDVNLRGAGLNDSDFSGCVLCKVDFTDADLSGANFTDATMVRPFKSDVEPFNDGKEVPQGDLNSYRSDFSGAKLARVRGMTQEMLDEAVAAPGREPDLDAARCARTGEPLVWRGGGPKPESEQDRPHG